MLVLSFGWVVLSYFLPLISHKAWPQLFKPLLVPIYAFFHMVNSCRICWITAAPTSSLQSNPLVKYVILVSNASASSFATDWASVIVIWYCALDRYGGAAHGKIGSINCWWFLSSSGPNSWRNRAWGERKFFMLGRSILAFPKMGVILAVCEDWYCVLGCVNVDAAQLGWVVLQLLL